MSVIVIDLDETARQLQSALSQSGAAVFVASGEEDYSDILAWVTPHFAVIDPTAGKKDPDRKFSHAGRGLEPQSEGFELHAFESQGHSSDRGPQRDSLEAKVGRRLLGDCGCLSF